MKVLIIGSGGREHAIAYKLNQSNKVDEIFAIPGNPGIASIATCIDGNIENHDFIIKFAQEKKIELTVIGPEVPLCNGLADDMEKVGLKVFGPKKHAATLEGSKSFSKQFMDRHNIPTAMYDEVTDYNVAIELLKKYTFPVVLKADGLAAGKGVVIAQNEQEAKLTLKEMLIDGILDGAGSKVVIEEFLEGFECSLLCFTDGDTIIPMVSVKDHKQIFDGNNGPNTGGMGTVSPNPFLEKEVEKTFEKDILDPFMKGLKVDEMDYRGVVFIGLMIKDQKAKVLEFNVRFGDPETQAIMLRLESDLFDIMDACATKSLNKVNVLWNDKHVACLVLASGGYPDNYKKGIIIFGLETLNNNDIIFHAGTTFENSNIVTSGGRVLNIMAIGNSMNEALDKVYDIEKSIEFEGKYFRKDIGLN